MQENEKKERGKPKQRSMLLILGLVAAGVVLVVMQTTYQGEVVRTSSEPVSTAVSAGEIQVCPGGETHHFFCCVCGSTGGSKAKISVRKGNLPTTCSTCGGNMDANGDGTVDAEEAAGEVCYTFCKTLHKDPVYSAKVITCNEQC